MTLEEHDEDRRKQYLHRQRVPLGRSNPLQGAGLYHVFHSSVHDDVCAWCAVFVMYPLALFLATGYDALDPLPKPPVNVPPPLNGHRLPTMLKYVHAKTRLPTEAHAINHPSLLFLPRIEAGISISDRRSLIVALVDTAVDFDRDTHSDSHNDPYKHQAKSHLDQQPLPGRQLGEPRWLGLCPASTLSFLGPSRPQPHSAGVNASLFLLCDGG
jgi:hypothetical protein